MKNLRIYEYTGDGTHTFPTLGVHPKPGDRIESEESLNSPFLREITVASTTENAGLQIAQPAAVEQPAVQMASTDQPTGEEHQPDGPAIPQTDNDDQAHEDEHHDEDEHTEVGDQ